MRISKLLPLIFLTVFLAVGGQVFLKYGIQKIGTINIKTAANIIQSYSKILLDPRIIIGLLFYAASALLWLFLISKTELSYVYPFMGIAFILITIASRFVFAESVSFYRWLGSIIIFVGITISAFSSKGS